MWAGEHINTFSLLSHAWSQTDSLQTLEKTEKQLVLHVTSHITEAEVDILPDYKKCKNLGTKENMPWQSSNSLRTPRVVFAKVRAFLPIHLYVWNIEKTVDKEETEQSILCFHFAKFSELNKKKQDIFPISSSFIISPSFLKPLQHFWHFLIYICDKFKHPFYISNCMFNLK